MAFYLVTLKQNCAKAICLKAATTEVRGFGSQSFGCYCLKHAEQKKRHLDKVHGITDKE